MSLNFGVSIVIVVWVILKQAQVFCVDCSNNEIHLILKELEIHVCGTNGENFNETATIKKIMKEEALRPLFLMRDDS